MIIKTERLLLRPFRESDAADVPEYLAEPAVNCFASRMLNSPEEATAEMERKPALREHHAVRHSEERMAILKGIGDAPSV